MEIRMLTPKDAEAYYILRLEALLDSPDSFLTLYKDAADKPIDNTRVQLASDDSVTFGAYDEGKLIGNMTLIRNSEMKLKHKASIVAVYIAPSHRGTGIADKLLGALLEHADHWKGLESLNLMVASCNERAIKLYLRFGFEKYGTELHAMKIGERYIDEDLMVKFLK